MAALGKMPTYDEVFGEDGLREQVEVHGVTEKTAPQIRKFPVREALSFVVGLVSDLERPTYSLRGARGGGRGFGVHSVSGSHMARW